MVAIFHGTKKALHSLGLEPYPGTCSALHSVPGTNAERHAAQSPGE